MLKQFMVFLLKNYMSFQDGKYFEDLVGEFIDDFMDADFVIGHNVNFDIKFLAYELLFLRSKL